MNTRPRICLLGFGEVGQRFATDLRVLGVADICAWDIQFSNPHSKPSRAINGGAVRLAADAQEAARDATLVISAVTAALSLSAAKSIARALHRDAFFLDVNSVSPGIRRQVGVVIEQAGARYVEAAIMSPIAPLGISSPILLGGPHAVAFLPLADLLGFSGVKAFATQLGPASAAKMCRSVIVKGMEALLAEALLSARHYDVEDTVLDSLSNLFPGNDWSKLSRYMISRSLIHGRRRAEEMREVAQTVREAGVTPVMTLACMERQEWAARHAGAVNCEDLGDMLDSLLGDEPDAEYTLC